MKELEVSKKIDQALSAIPKGAVESFELVQRQAQAISLIKECITDEYLKPIKENLQNSKIGFLTDSKSGYNNDTLRECIIYTTMIGLMPVGNQFNIIASKPYITKEGFTALLRKIPNLKYQLRPNTPQRADGIVTVTTEILWTLSGVSRSETVTFPVIANNGMGNDAILGKAERKAKAWLYNELTNSCIGDGDAEEVTIDVKAVEIKPSKNIPESVIKEFKKEEQKEIPEKTLKAIEWLKANSDTLEKLESNYLKTLKVEFEGLIKQEYEKIKVSLSA